jgi:ferredoxin
MKILRRIIEIDEERCDGCGQCVLACAEGAIEIIEGKARIVKDSYCDGLGACLGECPQGALQIIEREAEDFDPEAVEHFLEQKEKHQQAAQLSMACGCPSSNIQVFNASCEEANRPVFQAESSSALSHWPVQVRLVPPTAPFLQGANLLIAADCAPVAYPNFHRDFLQGKAVMLGCPKFDNPEEYIKKFAEIFRVANIQSITVVDMEVPCCSALPAIVRKGMEAAGKEIPLEEVVISVRGETLRNERKVA